MCRKKNFWKSSFKVEAYYKSHRRVKKEIFFGPMKNDLIDFFILLVSPRKYEPFINLIIGSVKYDNDHP